MKFIVYIASLFFIPAIIFAQDEDFSKSLSKQNITIEFGGNAGWLSANYEHLFFDHFYLHAGLGLTFVDELPSDFGGIITSAPVLVLLPEYLYDFSSHFLFEAGIGVVLLLNNRYKGYWFFSKEGNNSLVVPTGKFGFRYYLGKSGLNIGLFASPFFNVQPLAVTGFIGLYTGYSF